MNSRSELSIMSMIYNRHWIYPGRNYRFQTQQRRLPREIKEFVSYVKRQMLKQELAFHLFMVICIGMFFYQSAMILREYLQFRSTKVKKVQNEIPLQTPSPAITFCLNDFLSYKIINEMSPETVKTFNRLNQQLEKSDNSTQDFILTQELENYMNLNQIKLINRFKINEAFNKSLDFNRYIDDCLIIRQNVTLKCPFFKNKTEYMQDTQKCTTYFP